VCPEATRAEVGFPSGGSRCAAWLYRPAAGAGPAPCIVMAHGFSLTRHEGLDIHARALASAGIAVLAFDFRYLGDSGGVPRQRFRSGLQVADYRAAFAYVRELDWIDRSRLAVWGFSFSGGHAATIAAGDTEIAAAILICPFLDGRARVLSSLRRDPLNVGWLLPRAIADEAGHHNLVPVTANPGQRAAMSFPGESAGFFTVRGSDSPWLNEISPGAMATLAMHRPVTLAPHVRCPTWVCLGERDISVSNAAVARFARDAPSAELHRYEIDHFDPFHGSNASGIAGDAAAWLAAQLIPT
jgi:uncharacterized protein